MLVGPKLHELVRGAVTSRTDDMEAKSLGHDIASRRRVGRCDSDGEAQIAQRRVVREVDRQIERSIARLLRDELKHRAVVAQRALQADDARGSRTDSKVDNHVGSDGHATGRHESNRGTSREKCRGGDQKGCAEQCALNEVVESVSSHG